MDLGLEGAGAQEFFDELSEDDHMPGVEEAEEAKDGKKKKATAGKINRFLIKREIFFSEEKDCE